MSVAVNIGLDVGKLFWEMSKKSHTDGNGCILVVEISDKIRIMVILSNNLSIQKTVAISDFEETRQNFKMPFWETDVLIEKREMAGDLLQRSVFGDAYSWDKDINIDIFKKPV